MKATAHAYKTYVNACESPGTWKTRARAPSRASSPGASAYAPRNESARTSEPRYGTTAHLGAAGLFSCIFMKRCMKNTQEYVICSCKPT